MHREGHLGVTIAFYTPLGAIAYAAGFQQVALGGGLATVALAMAPDVDMKIPGLRHRGPTHTVWFATVVGVVGLFLGGLMGSEYGLLSAVGLGVFGGLVGSVSILAHLAADALTPAGVRPFAPWNDREVCFSLWTASNPIANYGLLVLGGAFAVGGLALAAGVAR